MYAMLDAFVYYSINVRATVLGVIGLNEEFPELVDRSIILTLMLPDEQAFDVLNLQMGERYLVYGMDYFDMGWLQSQNPGLWKSNTPTLTVRNQQQLKNLSEEYAVPMIAHLTDTAEDFLRSDEGKLWSQTLEGISVNNQAFPILGVDNLGCLAEFALGNTRLVQGRDFTEEELAQGAKVCILAESLAAANGVAVGDAITVQYYNYDENSPYQSMLSSGRGVVNPSAWFFTATTPFVNEGETYTVIGVYRSQNEWADPATNLYAFTPNTVFVPKASVSGTMDYCQQGLFRTYVLHNEQIEAFQELAANAGYSDLFFCDDHGYAAVATILHDYEEVAERALMIGLCLSALIAILFLLLFPMQQQKTLNVMASMGATIQNRLGYIFYYSLSLLLPGCILGFVASILLWEQVTEKLTAQASIALAMEVDLPVLMLSAMTALFVILAGALLLVVVATSLPVVSEDLAVFRSGNLCCELHFEMENKSMYGFDSVDSYAAMNRLRKGILDEIRETATKKNIKRIHMVLATSSDFTFFLAQGFSKNHDPEVVVYHYDRNSNTKYPWGISNILTPANAVVRQSASSSVN